MSTLNQTPSAGRLHISFFGCRNAGKSSVVNAVTGQELSIVSDIKGTTTDPVTKSMELLPLGPVVIIDTPGIDDVGELGELRVKRTKRILNKTDIAVLVVDATAGPTTADQELITLFREKELPYLIVYNKSDLISPIPDAGEHEIWVSALKKTNIQELKERLGHLIQTDIMTKKLVGHLLKPLDTVILVCPIDESAPTGRLILPQQQTIRDILEAGAVSIVVKDNELKNTLENIGKKPKLVITDSQAFGKVSKDTPEDILLTSFSILFARYKGELETMIAGVAALNKIRTGDKILICEGCTHHRQCGDIGTVKLPNWIRQFTKAEPEFTFTSGTEFPDDLTQYKLIIHCGGCMLNAKEMKYRIKCACDQNVPVTNYGMTIAYIHGVLERSLKPFPQAAALLHS